MSLWCRGSHAIIVCSSHCKSRKPSTLCVSVMQSFTPRSPELFVLRQNNWDEDLQYPVQVSVFTGNVVHLQLCPGTLVKDVIRQCMYDDRLSCGTPVLECTPPTINRSIAKMQASGGKLRLATFDGELLQDNKIIPNLNLAVSAADPLCGRNRETRSSADFANWILVECT